MCPRDVPDDRVAEQFRRVAPSAQRIPALHDDSLALDIGGHVIVLIVRMYFILDKGRHDRDLRKESVQFGNVET